MTQRLTLGWRGGEGGRQEPTSEPKSLLEGSCPFPNSSLCTYSIIIIFKHKGVVPAFPPAAGEKPAAKGAVTGCCLQGPRVPSSSHRMAPKFQVPWKVAVAGLDHGWRTTRPPNQAPAVQLHPGPSAGCHVLLQLPLLHIRASLVRRSCWHLLLAFS